ncbi:MAG: class I SAM-dependent methyltransferase [Candidatus Saganbacteria bacterium]|nr:class I SAM-dependent methyltransferase [Candidatus Saganbacteria bacterium]
MDIDSVNKVAKLWGDKAKMGRAANECNWLDSYLIQKYYIHPTITGNSLKNWFIWVKETFFHSPVNRALNLGCGDGCLERHAVQLNLFNKCDSYDISQEAIDVAKSKAKEMGILEKVNYEVKDINSIKLEKEYYDVVFFSMSLHHIENLEHVLGEVNSALKEDGFLILNEYVGPSRFQWTDKQLKIANVILSLLPERYRLDPKTNTIRKYVERSPLHYMISTDPSEAVRSAEIIPLILEKFKIIKKHDYGGMILHLIINDIILNFDEKERLDLLWLKFLFYAEKFLVKLRILNSDFTIIIAKKK